MKAIQKLAVLMLPILLLTSACNFLGEDEFAGSKKASVTELNGPFQMKIQTVGGASVLVVLNTNYRYEAENGSLQFYSLGNPALPEKATNLSSLSLPSNVSDFEIIDGNTLYITNRNKSELWVYDLSGSEFSRRLNAKGEPLVIRTPSNSVGLTSYNRTSDGHRMLVITSQRVGTVSLLDLSTLEYVDPRTLGLSNSFDAVQVVGSTVYGAKYYMSPRRSQNPEKNDNLGVTGSRRLGVGVTKSIYFGTDNDIVVSMNALQNGLHAFRFATFLNSSNLSWELSDWESDTEISPGVDREGTDEEGFRGMDIDTAKNIYLASRTDNSIYKIPENLITLDKGADNINTTGFNENSREHRLNINFDSDETDKVFPRLGDLVVNKDGSTLWVLGLGTNSLYRVDLSSNTITHTTIVGEVPQRLIGYPVGGPYQYIYVANTKSDTMSIVNATDMTVAATIETP